MAKFELKTNIPLIGELWPKDWVKEYEHPQYGKSFIIKVKIDQSQCDYEQSTYVKDGETKTSTHEWVFLSPEKYVELSRDDLWGKMIIIKKEEEGNSKTITISPLWDPQPADTKLHPPWAPVTTQTPAPKWDESIIKYGGGKFELSVIAQSIWHSGWFTDRLTGKESHNEIMDTSIAFAKVFIEKINND